MRSTLLAGLGAVTAAVFGTLCCIGPLLFVTLGVGAGLASTFAPLRPLFGLLTVGMLGVGFYTVYGRRAVSSVVRQGAHSNRRHGGVSAARTGPGKVQDMATEADAARVEAKNAAAKARAATAEARNVAAEMPAAPAEACATPGEACSLPRNRRREKILLWTATVLALVAWSFPTWSKLLV